MVIWLLGVAEQLRNQPHRPGFLDHGHFPRIEPRWRNDQIVMITKEKVGLPALFPGTCALPARRCACHDGKAVGSKQQATAPVCRGLARPVVAGPWTRGGGAVDP